MKKTVLFIQFPLLDNDTTGRRENFPFAGLWLSHALAIHPEGDYWNVMLTPEAWDDLDNAHLLAEILACEVDAVAFTVCLWNVERAMRFAQLLREVSPETYLMAGGPEVSLDHPFLLESCFDALVIGEGESVFPELLKGLRLGKMPAYDSVLLAGENGWTHGSKSPPSVDLAAVQVPVDRFTDCIQARPLVYMETARGCPLTCTYCRYHHLQKGVRTLSAEAVADRVNQFRLAGAREIRFVDPTFNSRKDFDPLLERLAKLNEDQSLRFYAELRADTITMEQAELLARARFADIEVGVQSTDPAVLRAIRRPANIQAMERGIRLLADAGVPVTLDLMYGLPEQTMADVLRSIEWARSLGPNIQIQCMQTLLLPGTDLREQADQYGIQALPWPPYGVLSTATLSEKEMMQIEILLNESDDLPADPVTPRFVGYTLSGLFKNPVELRAGVVSGTSNRRAVMIRGTDLNARRTEICNTIEQSIIAEPDMLWQFVLCVEQEEPIELMEAMINTIRKQPIHLLDRYASAEFFGQIASRRIFVRLKKGRHFDSAWRTRLDDLLDRHFV